MTCWILQESHGRTITDFEQHVLFHAAMLYWLQVIGEIAAHITQETKAEHPEIDWQAMIGLRNCIDHQYEGLGSGIIWDTITVAVPDLLAKLNIIDF